MVTLSCKLQHRAHSTMFTIEDMRKFAGEAWGPLGIGIVEQWCKFNSRYFGGVEAGAADHH